jgi:adenylate cyclase
MSENASRVRRKLTTIMAADAAGYSTAMDADEVGTLEELKESRQVFSRFIERHEGRIANTAGDGMIAEFPSVVEAVQCAIEVQNELAGRRHRKGLRFRIGIHLGDVMIDGDDLLGEGVNLAARLQTMAEPGGILISRQVYDQVHSKLSVGFEYLGERKPKNFAESVPVYSLTLGRRSKTQVFGRHAGEVEDTPPAPEEKASGPSRRSPAYGSSDRKAGRYSVVIRHAQALGAVWAFLLVIDLATGNGMWAQWPGLAFLIALGMEASPLVSDDGRIVRMVRLGVVIVALVLINLFSWSGHFWAGWPTAALLLALLLQRFRARA